MGVFDFEKVNTHVNRIAMHTCLPQLTMIRFLCFVHTGGHFSLVTRFTKDSPNLLIHMYGPRDSWKFQLKLFTVFKTTSN
jgi:hypothetical protein